MNAGLSSGRSLRSFAAMIQTGVSQDGLNVAAFKETSQTILAPATANVKACALREARDAYQLCGVVQVHHAQATSRGSSRRHS